MKSSLFRVFFAVIAMVLWGTMSIAAKAQAPVAGFAHCKQGDPLASNGPHARLARGFNLPNWDPNYDAFKPTDALLSLLLKEGFHHIRLPVEGEQLMEAFVSADQVSKYLDALQQTVLRLHNLGFALTVDMHPGDRFQRLHRTSPNEAFLLLTNVWSLIADRAKNWPDDGIYFELLNEPVPPQEIWWPQAQKLVTHLNRVAKNRGLIVGTAQFQRYEPLVAAVPLNGTNLTYAIHYYDPFVFTHQAMTWEEGSYLSRVGQLPFPAGPNHPALKVQIDKMRAQGDVQAVSDLKSTYETEWDAARIAEDMKLVGDWAKRNKVAVIVNEFGVLDFDVDKWARVDWLRAVRKGAEAHCLGWTHWDFSDGFAMVDPATTLPDAYILDALLSQKP